MRPLYCCVKSRKIHLMQSSLVNNSVDPQSVRLLTIYRKMLHTGSYIRLLYSLYKRNRHLRYKIWVLTHIFKITPAQRCPLDIDTRRKNNILASATRFCAKNLTTFFCPLRVPGSCYCTVRRKIGHSIITVIYILPVIIDKLLTHSHRTVRHVKLRYSKARHSCRPEQTCAMYHSNLLIQGHLIYK